MHRETNAHAWASPSDKHTQHQLVQPPRWRLVGEARSAHRDHRRGGSSPLGDVLRPVCLTVWLPITRLCEKRGARQICTPHSARSAPCGPFGVRALRSGNLTTSSQANLAAPPFGRRGICAPALLWLWLSRSWRIADVGWLSRNRSCIRPEGWLSRGWFAKRGIVRLADSGGWNVIVRQMRRCCDWLAVAWRLKDG